MVDVLKVDLFTQQRIQAVLLEEDVAQLSMCLKDSSEQSIFPHLVDLERRFTDNNAEIDFTSEFQQLGFPSVNYVVNYAFVNGVLVYGLASRDSQFIEGTPLSFEHIRVDFDLRQRNGRNRYVVNSPFTGESEKDYNNRIEAYKMLIISLLLLRNKLRE